jgi:hypothetical protein
MITSTQNGSEYLKPTLWTLNTLKPKPPPSKCRRHLNRSSFSQDLGVYLFEGKE